MRLKNLLQEHNQVLVRKDFLLISIIDCIYKNTGIVLKKNECVLKDTTLYIKTKPIYKEKIVSQKENLLVLLKDFQVFNIV